MKPKILIVDDHCIFREGLCAMIARESDLHIVGEASNGRQALQQTRRLNPDLIVMDINMPDLNGIDATAQILSEFPAMKIIALSMHSDKRFILGMLKAGACGFLLKEGAFKELLEAIRTALAGQIYISPKVAGTVVTEFRQRLSVEDISQADTLTAREREVLQLISEGRSTRQIADALNLSIKTIEARRKGIKDKLGLHSVAELTKFAIQEGLTSIEN
jgi:DNA-binding NarL/FixJ family response regulator